MYNEVQNYANKFRKISSNINTANRNLKAKCNTIRNSWRGDTYNSYKNLEDTCLLLANKTINHSNNIQKLFNELSNNILRAESEERERISRLNKNNKN